MIKLTKQRNNDIITPVARETAAVVSDTYREEVLFMDYIVYLFVLVAILEIIKNIKK